MLRLVFALLVLLGASPFFVVSTEAQVPAPPAAPPPGAQAGGVTFGAIDRATVRVFAVRNVTQETVQGRFRQRVLGLPEAGHGTGVVVDPRGVVVTAKHVVEGARQIAVRMPGSGPLLPARTVYEDPDLDFAVLLVLAPGELPSIALPEQPVPLTVRQTVDAIGYPFDPDRSQPQSARGIISGAMDDGHLQLDMSLNPGNSGGPLLDGDEHLIGIVVARADPTQGAQGIGIAVPVPPIRAAYDRVRRSGALSREYRQLRADAVNAGQTAHAVDAIVRLGGVDLLREAADFVDNPEASERLDTLRSIAEQTRDPDLLALLAAYFWDAAQVMVERAGGVATPAQMPPGPAQQLADDLWRRALALAARARDADPSVLQRSPFVGYLAGTGNTQQPAGWQPPASGPGHPQAWRPGAPVEQQPDDRERQRWTPFLQVGPAFFDGFQGFGIQIAALLPLGTGGRPTGAKFRMVAGPSVDIGTWHGSAAYFVGAELGFVLRFGGRVGGTLFALWSPGLQRSPSAFDREPHTRSLTPAAGRFGFGIRIGTMHVGMAVRILEPAGDSWDERGLYWMMSLPQVGWTF